MPGLKYAAVILHPYHVTYFQRIAKIYYLSLDFLKAWQSVLIRKIKLLTFTFITTTLLDVLVKTNTNITHLSLHILALTIKVDYPERCQHIIILLIPDYHKEILDQNCFD